MSFDHDLGDQTPTGFDLAKEIINRDLYEISEIPDGFSYAVHSANPVGAANISGLMDGYLKHKGMIRG